MALYGIRQWVYNPLPFAFDTGNAPADKLRVRCVPVAHV
jgi:hypothetical protein